MAEFEFVLPHKRQELLNTTGNNYCVTKVLNEKECTDQLRSECRKEFFAMTDRIMDAF